MSVTTHFSFVNAPERGRSFQENCGEYKDAPVCKNGDEDVCEQGVGGDSTIYRGCCKQSDGPDCADNPNGNRDDECCLGLSLNPVGDNIDHGSCYESDAEYASSCFWGWDNNPEPECEGHQDIPV